MRQSPPSWFAKLRRDQGLFALVGALAVLLGLLQPVAAAQNARFDGLLILCNASGSPLAPGDHQRQGPGCPLCPAGHLCSGMGVLAAPAVVPVLAFTPPGHGQRLSRPAANHPPTGRGQAPPSIRAPPLSA